MYEFEGKQSRKYTKISNLEDWEKYTGGYWDKLSETPKEFPCWALEDIDRTYCREYYHYYILYKEDLEKMLKAFLWL